VVDQEDIFANTDFVDYVLENTLTRVKYLELERQVGNNTMTMTNYPVGNFLITIKNAALAGKKEVTFPNIKLCRLVALALVKAGYLDEVKENKDMLEIKLTFRKKEPLMMGLKLISRPGLRIYENVSDTEKKKGPSIFILSTPKGVITSRQAIKDRVGGEVIAEIW
jgi:small subunit ribosomal protein S8